MKFGEELRNITKRKKKTSEIEKLKGVLLGAANAGKDIITIPHIEENYAYIFKSGEIWDWCKENNISVTGGGDETGYSYTFYWQ